MESLHHFLLLSSILFLSFAARMDARVPHYSSMVDRYRHWKVEHSKIYPTADESERRFEIFQENVNYIDAFNADINKTYTLGLNQFTDLTREERIARLAGYRPPRIWNASANYQPETVELDALPTSWDWRKKGAVTPVKDQTCGNCWLFAGVANVESVNFIATGKLSILSEQEIMDCDDLPGKGGCNGGWPQEVYEYVRHYSLTTEASYPNKPEAQKCDISKKKNRARRSARVSSFVNMPAFLSDEELMAAVVKRPVVVGVDVSSLDFGSYKSGVFTGHCNFKLNHVVQVVGFGEENGLKYWIARNSWGPGWGDGGYIKIQRATGRKEGLCGVNLTPSYPVY
ncbi:hypothetical protein QQ045_026321 [Rhodiola kirilowii]